MRHLLLFCAFLLALPSLALADKGTSGTRSHCNTPTVPSDGTLTPDPGWETIAGSTVGDASGEYVYDFCVIQGATYTFSFCQEGGSATYDTGLSIWNLGLTLELCNDDFCGLQSELSWVAPADGTYLIRIGGFGGQTGDYVLAYTSDANCNPVSVDPSTWGQVKAVYR